MTRLYIGTSGWSYQHWRDCFYRNIHRKDWLKFYAESFAAVEINGTFYRLQKPETFKKWSDETPPGFKFALKANRYLTHSKKLIDPEPSVLIEKTHAEPLNEKLTAVLWQLPGFLKKNSDRLNTFTHALRQWPEVRHAIELRHPSWFDDDTAACLAEAKIAVCQSDAESWPLWDRITSDLVYIRLHGHTKTYASRYSQSELAYWADKISDWLEQGRDVHVYFDNDAECAAPFNALTLQALVNERR